ncbi:SDR family NAD(P)-dependent oxidoreductase [Paenibacillus odorifer]|uniref:SDR family NAD(P)-dependent oxidoreductase n=1 Tax=Paenibacillus odorifer TaxID=189426 RepID=UPI00096D33BE|nr:SDR family NAD(P)-dependent oxidoreductase [Paenibacillus odorifer]OMD80181.1 short-chain dehydrogenase [Paenibacillus odorifer]
MMTKPIIVITGATSGLGQLVALEMAKQGAHLVLTTRSKTRSEVTEKMIKESVPAAEISFFYGDLSSMRDVTRLGQEISSVFPKIDVLINNAGLHGFEQRITADGFSEMMAVNYFAPWLLTQTLERSLRAAGNAKIINVASEASRRHGVLKLPEDLLNTASFTSRGSSEIYGKTKLLNIMFTSELARRWAGTGISVHALNPGFNVTGLGRELWFSSMLKHLLNFFRIGDPHKGAEIIIRLMTDPKYQESSGGYFNVGTGNPIVPVQPGGDRVMENKLWNDTRDILQQKGFFGN